MRYHLKIFLFFLLLIPAAGDCLAAGHGTLFVFSTEKEVRLRWNAPLGQPYQGFHVERKTPAGSWQRITPKPVEPLKDVAVIRQELGAAAESFLAFFDPKLKTIDQADFDQVMSDPVARSMIQLFSVQNPKMGRALGEMFDDTRLEPGKRFRYRVILLGRDGGQSVWAESTREIEHGLADQVAVVAGLTGEGIDSAALLSWEHEPQKSKSGDIIGYMVYRAEKPFGPFVQVSPDTVIPKQIDGAWPDYFFADRFLENNIPYWYRITAVNLLGIQGEPSATVKVIPKDQRPPRPPATFIARLLGQHVLLEWSRVEAADLAGYAVYRGGEAAGVYTRLVPAGKGEVYNPTTYLDTDVKEGDSFWYYVTSIDTSKNESPPSDKVQLFRPDVTPPLKPRGLRAVADSKGVHLKWQPNSEEDLAGYLVERTTGITGKGEKTEVVGPFFVQNTEPLTLTEFLDPVPEESQSRYGYRITAVDKAWNRSQSSEPVWARMPDGVPPRPVALYSALQQGGLVVLAWQVSVEEDLAGYAVFRKEIGGKGGYVRLNRILLDGSMVEYHDRPLKINTTYGYYMTAFDEAGNESAPSPELKVRYLDLEVEPPEKVKAEAQAQGVLLTWQQPGGDELRTVIIARKVIDGVKSATIATLRPNELEYLDRDVAKGNTYIYEVRNLDTAGNLSEPGGPVEVRLGK